MILLCLLVTLFAIVTRLSGCALGAFNLGMRRAGQLGMGMVQRREVGLIVSRIGLSLTVIGAELYGVVCSWLWPRQIAPFFLKLLFASEVAARKEIGPPNAGGIVASEDLCKIG